MSDLSNSPLKEVDPNSLNYLFDKDPLKMTEDDFNKVVAGMREWRARDKESRTKASATGQRRVPVKASNVPLPTQIDLDDL